MPQKNGLIENAFAVHCDWTAWAFSFGVTEMQPTIGLPGDPEPTAEEQQEHKIRAAQTQAAVSVEYLELQQSRLNSIFGRLCDATFDTPDEKEAILDEMRAVSKALKDVGYLRRKDLYEYWRATRYRDTITGMSVLFEKHPEFAEKADK